MPDRWYYGKKFEKIGQEHAATSRSAISHPQRMYKMQQICLLARRQEVFLSACHRRQWNSLWRTTLQCRRQGQRGLLLMTDFNSF